MEELELKTVKHRKQHEYYDVTAKQAIVTGVGMTLVLALIVGLGIAIGHGSIYDLVADLYHKAVSHVF